MIFEEINSLNLFEDFGSEDILTVKNAELVLSSYPVSDILEKNSIALSWISSNLESQKLVSNLKSRIDFIKNQKIIKLKEIEGDNLMSGEFKGLKAREDRIAAIIYDDSIYKDLNLVIENLKVLSSYLESLIWSLRTSINIIK